MISVETSFVALAAVLAGCLLAERSLCQSAPGSAPSSGGPAGQWRFDCQRPEIAPAHRVDEQALYDHRPTLALGGDGKPYANGMWTRTVPVEAETWYRLEAHFQPERVRQVDRSILARLLWFDADGEPIGRPEYPRTLPGTDAAGWRTLQQDYRSPAAAATARLELIYRWDADGEVRFGGMRFEPTDAPPPRKVRLATVFHKPDARSADGNLRQFGELVAQAGRRGADIVCLPEGATLYGTKRDYVTAAEPIPGPSTKMLGQIAAEHEIYIVAGLFERDGPAVYNTAVLIDRRGNLTGKYRKVCLPREEIEGGVSPGRSLPVFATDFGTVGIMTCWDAQFPEPARTLARRGAEVILLPIWGGNVTLVKARAIENQVYVVSCTYGMVSAVFGLDGEILAEATAEQPVAVAEVDLAERKLWPWLGDFRNRIHREMPAREALRSADE